MNFQRVVLMGVLPALLTWSTASMASAEVFNITGIGQWTETGYEAGVEEARQDAVQQARAECASGQAARVSEWSEVEVVGFGQLHISADFQCTSAG